MQRKTLLKQIAEKKVFVFDLDGVLYYGDTLIDKADKAVEVIRNAGREVAFLTNNSGKRKESVCNKLNSLGVACNVNEVYTSVDSAIRYLKTQQELIKGVLFIGSTDAESQLAENGVIFAPADNCTCLLAGFKRDLCYDDVAKAVSALRRQVPFIICNRDPYFPDKDGGILPGCGYVIGAIEGGIGRRADINVGKPEKCMLEMVCKAYDVSMDEIAVIGDSYNSDIVMAKNACVPAIYIGGKDDLDAGVFSFKSVREFADVCF